MTEQEQLLARVGDTVRVDITQGHLGVGQRRNGLLNPVTLAVMGLYAGKQAFISHARGIRPSGASVPEPGSTKPSPFDSR